MNLKHSPRSLGIISAGICFIYISTGSVKGIFAKISLNEPKASNPRCATRKRSDSGLAFTIANKPPGFMGRRYFKPRTLSARSGSDTVIFCITRSYLSCVRNVPSGKITKASDPKSFARRRTPSTSCSLFFDPRFTNWLGKRFP